MNYSVEECNHASIFQIIIDILWIDLVRESR